MSEFVDLPVGQSRVVERLDGLMRSGVLSRGQALPTVRALASELQVDKGTVVRALAGLQDAGVITRQGRRLHVADRRPRERQGRSSLRAVAGASASALSGQSIVVLTSVELGSGSHRAPNWSPDVVEGALTAAHVMRRGAFVIHPETADEASVRHLIEGRPMGCVIAACADFETRDRVATQMHRAGVPVAIFGDDVTDDSVHDTVTGDHAAGAAMLVHAAAGRGCRRIQRYWPHRHGTKRRPPWLDLRDAGFEQAVAELGQERLEPIEYVRPPDGGEDEPARFELRVRLTAGFLAQSVLGPTPIDAVMCASDAQALEAAAAVKLLGREPNRDVLIIGYDGYAADCPENRLTPVLPALSTRQDYVAIGRKLVEALAARAVEPSRDVEQYIVRPSLLQFDAAGDKTRTERAG
ncbi:MAG: GntR family transcriptional regulator [Phycisphaerae bacterium]